MASKRLENLSGKQFGEWRVLRYLGNKRWECQCSCGVIKSVLTSTLKSGESTSCGHINKSKHGDLAGKKFGEWQVLERVGTRGLYKCKCSCGKEAEVYSYDLVTGKSKSCGHLKHIEDLTGRQFSDWEVIEKLPGGKYKCKCNCGNQRIVSGSDLLSGKSKSCGHSTNALVNIENKRFGEWTVIKHIGYGRWECRCSCGTVKILRHTELINGESKSCGCKQKENLMDTMLSRYGDISYMKIGNRTNSQLTAVLSKEALSNYIASFGCKPTLNQLATKLGLSYSRTVKLIHDYNLENIVDIYPLYSSYENEIVQMLQENTEAEILTHYRPFKNKQELDIYIPSKRIAIEFNGDYWHSEECKAPTYHQDKTIECSKLGIHLIHIFEYEWVNERKREVISELLFNKLGYDTIIYARDCKIEKYVGNNRELQEFIQENHLQGKANYEIAYVLRYNSDIVGAITFGKPRYNGDFEYELIRLVFKRGCRILGGARRLFSHFVSEYKPNSILSYCDISKFNGGIYSQLGFETSIDNITKPNYIWINLDDNDIKSRYSVQKHKLLAVGLGVYGDTESEIMRNLGYVRIYDCGNLRFEWRAS